MVDLDVLEEEGGGAAFIRLAGSGAVLPGAEQEEEGDDAEVDNGQASGLEAQYNRHNRYVHTKRSNRTGNRAGTLTRPSIDPVSIHKRYNA